MAQPESRWLGVDIGGTKLAVRVETDSGEWTTTLRWPAGDVAADLAALRDVVLTARRQAGGPFDRVAVAAAPTLDPAGTVVAWPSRPSWVGAALTEVLANAAGGPVLTVDDGSLAALAEAHAGGCADLVYLGLGTGLGGGLVLGGRLILGAYGGAGELGHLPVQPAGPPCRCGRRGCLQARVSGAALAHRAGRLRGRDTSTGELVAGAAEGRRWALRVVDEAAGTLARAILAVSELVQPAEVRIGGGLGAALPLLPARVAAALAPMGRPGHRLPLVGSGRLGESASLAGAALLARNPALAELARPAEAH
ncbi:ROK family protein [Plantactinospora sp. CA-290183]|uniref:ROK family protein n=1 Tax=Plantactinospora sp. CA-290183 TaxID=3240006 RepID=UPI003D924685